MEPLPGPSVIDGILCPPTENEPLIASARLKAHPEDFFVDEIPKYEASGEGEHLFVQLRKTNVGSSEMLEALQSQLDVRERDIGLAGQKDRRAVTQQWVSVPRTCEEKLQQFQSSGIEILNVRPHANKLRTGHLVGNRFRIRLRNIEWGTSEIAQLQQRMDQLQAVGFANYYGPQRFGIDGRNVRKGIAELRGTSKKRRLKRFLISAAQSAVFNLVVAGRVHDAELRNIVPGDVVCSSGGIKPFSAPDDASQPDYLPMGPLPGPKCMPAKGNAARYEKQAMELMGLSERSFSALGKRGPGTRRVMISLPKEANVTAADDGSGDPVFEFVLSSGSFATTLLTEFCGEFVTRDR